MSQEFPPLNNDDDNFIKLESLLSEEFKRICHNIPNLPLQDAPLDPNHVPIIELDLFKQFDQLGVKDSAPNIFLILNKIFPFFIDNFYISFTMDLSAYSLHIRDLYNKIYYYLFFLLLNVKIS